jgi:hypothetical protein
VCECMVTLSSTASLAQSVERETLNLKVAGSTPAWGYELAICFVGSLFLRVALLFLPVPVVDYRSCQPSLVIGQAQTVHCTYFGELVFR